MTNKIINFFLKNTFRKEITLVILVKLILLYLLWWFFFSTPFSEKLNKDELSQRYSGISKVEP